MSEKAAWRYLFIELGQWPMPHSSDRPKEGISDAASCD
jgi:hypothetical protein